MSKTKNNEAMLQEQNLTRGHESKINSNYVIIGRGKLSIDLLREFLLQASRFLRSHEKEQAEYKGLMIKARRLHDRLLSNGGRLRQNKAGEIIIEGETISLNQLERILFFGGWNLLEKESLSLYLLSWWISLQILEPEENTPWDFALLAEEWLKIPHLHILSVLEMFNAFAE